MCFDVAYYPMGGFEFQDDECFCGGEWIRMIAEPARQTVQRDQGCLIRDQFSDDDEMVMQTLCTWQVLTRSMLYTLLRMQRSALSGEELDAILARMTQMRLMASFRFAAKDGSVSAPVYCMLAGGTVTYRQMTGVSHYALDLLETPARLESMLTANRVMMAFLDAGAPVRDMALRRTFFEHKHANPNAIIRPTASFMLGAQRVFVEVVRRGESWESDLSGKLVRYAAVSELEDAYPLLILCGEDAAHCSRMSQLAQQMDVDLQPLFLEAKDTRTGEMINDMYCFDGGERCGVSFVRKGAA